MKYKVSILGLIRSKQKKRSSILSIIASYHTKRNHTHSYLIWVPFFGSRFLFLANARFLFFLLSILLLFAGKKNYLLKEWRMERRKKNTLKIFDFNCCVFPKIFFFLFFSIVSVAQKYFELLFTIRIFAEWNEKDRTRIFQIEEIPFHLNYFFLFFFYNTRVDVKYSAINSRE